MLCMLGYGQTDRHGDTDGRADDLLPCHVPPVTARASDSAS